jgi:hypothetical protein
MNNLSRILSKPLAEVYCREITTGFRFQSPLSFDKNSNDGNHKSSGFCACGMCKRGLTIGSDAHKPTGFCACGICRREMTSDSKGDDVKDWKAELEIAQKKNMLLEEEIHQLKSKHRSFGQHSDLDKLMAEGILFFVLFNSRNY